MSSDYHDYTPDEFRRLDAGALKEWMRKLFREEAALCGMPPTDWFVTDEVNAPDKGCDGKTESHQGRSDWFPTEKTCWQFRTGEKSQPARLHDVFGPIPCDVLRQGGAYVLVASGASGHTAAEDRRNKLVELATELNLPIDKIRVDTCERLAEWCRCFDSLSKLPGAALTVAAWRDGDNQFRNSFRATDEWHRRIEKIRQALSVSGDIVHVHLAGRPGVGKTRLALEIVQSDVLLSGVYFPQFSETALNLVGDARKASGRRLLAIVDEVSDDEANQLWEHARRSERRIRLITIGTTIVPKAEGREVIEVPPLGDPEMRQLLSESYGSLPREHVDFVVRFAEGYVKLARLTADAVAQNPEVGTFELLLKNGEVGKLLERLLSGLDARVRDSRVRDSLFVPAVMSRVGWKGDRAAEGQAVAEHLGMNWPQVQRDIQNIHTLLGIAPLAGSLRYISPTPLANYLAVAALQAYPDALRTLPDQLPSDSAREAFYERLRELAEFPVAQDICREQLDRFFFLPDFDSRSAARIWSCVSHADPERAVSVLRDALERATHEERRKFEVGRSRIIATLTRLARDEATFDDAMHCLAELAVDENQGWRNNATGEFCDRFQVTLGGTTVAYVDRLRVLDDLLSRAEPGYHVLAIKALSRVADTHEMGFGGTGGVGSRPAGAEWHPQCRDDDVAARRAALQRLSAAVDGPAEVESSLTEAAQAMLGLLDRPELASEVRRLVLRCVERFPNARDQLRRELLRGVNGRALRRDSASHDAPPNARAELYAALTDDSFAGRLHRMLGDSYDDPAPDAELDRLADELLQHPEWLAEQWTWLTSGVPHAAKLGARLGRVDSTGQLLSAMLRREQRGDDPRFPVAYLLAYTAHRPDWLPTWFEAQLAGPEPDDELLFELCIRSSPKGAMGRIRQLAERGRIRPQRFEQLAFGAWVREPSSEEFAELMNEFARCDNLRSAALRMIAARSKQHPEESEGLRAVMVDLLTDPRHILDRTSDVWVRVAVQQAANLAVPLARAILAAHRDDPEWLNNRPDSEHVLAACVRHDPWGVWQELAADFETEPQRHRSEPIRRLVVLLLENALPVDEMLAWARGDAARRAPILAELAEPDYSSESTLAARVALEFGHLADVQGTLASNLTRGTFMGRRSDMWSQRAQALQRLAESTPSAPLRRWGRATAKSLLAAAADQAQREQERDLTLRSA